MVRAAATVLLAEGAQGAYGDALDLRDAATESWAEAAAAAVLTAVVARVASLLYDYCRA